MCPYPNPSCRCSSLNDELDLYPATELYYAPDIEPLYNYPAFTENIVLFAEFSSSDPAATQDSTGKFEANTPINNWGYSQDEQLLETWVGDSSQRPFRYAPTVPVNVEPVTIAQGPSPEPSPASPRTRLRQIVPRNLHPTSTASTNSTEHHSTARNRILHGLVESSSENGRKRHKCLCGLLFTTKKHVKRHIEVETRPRPICRACGKSLCRRDYRKKHEESTCPLLRTQTVNVFESSISNQTV